MTKQSFCLPIFEDAFSSHDELLAYAAEIGYEATEVWGWDRRFDGLAETAARHGLRLCSFTGHESIESGLNDPSEFGRIEKELTVSIERAAAVGADGVIAFPGSRRRDQSDWMGLVETGRALRKIAPAAERAGVNINVEILNSKLDHDNYQGDLVDWGIALCEFVGSPNVKILFDIYHVQIMQGDIIRSLRRALPYIGHIHTAGHPGRKDLDDLQELNYRGICRALSDMGYSGYIGHEFFPRGDKKQALADAFSVCRIP
ncbi:MAG: TIM barrel protein [Fimbriimonadaceae bacterium]